MRASFVALMVVCLAGLTAVPAASQATTPRPTLRPAADGLRSVEYFVSRHRLGATQGEPTDLDGAGGRILWSLAPLAESPSSPLARLALGGYLIHTPADAQDFELWHYGVQADTRVTRQPIAGRIDPLLSFGVGAVRVREPGRVVSYFPPLRVPEAHSDPEGLRPWMPSVVPPLPRVTRTEPPRVTTDLSFVPGVGAKLRLMPGLDLRGDMRWVIDFRERIRRDLELSTGISMSL